MRKQKETTFYKEQVDKGLRANTLYLATDMARRLRAIAALSGMNISEVITIMIASHPIESIEKKA